MTEEVLDFELRSLTWLGAGRCEATFERLGRSGEPAGEVRRTTFELDDIGFDKPGVTRGWDVIGVWTAASAEDIRAVIRAVTAFAEAAEPRSRGR